jgi:heterodisulfide reductase subunit C2
MTAPQPIKKPAETGPAAVPPDPREVELLEAVREMVRPCIQCGTCTGSCPNAFAMDLTPRRMWRTVLVGDPDELLESKTFSLCSVCYTCTLRCPRGLPLTEAMSRLKQIAARRKLPVHRAGEAFYQQFLNSVRRHGRVREMEFMTRYFISLKNPMLPFRFTPLGIRLMAKGKIDLKNPLAGPSAGSLDRLFAKVDALEEETP